MSSTDKAPLVSICIPTYNGAGFIKETLASITEQSYKNIEIIITDDNSSDGTADIISQINDDRIKLFRNEQNYGFPENWNHCLSMATGKYIKVVCQDDILMPECIAAQVKILEENDNVSLVTGSSYVIDGNGNNVIERHVYDKDTVINGHKFARKTLTHARNYYGEPALNMYRKSSLTKDTRYDKDVSYCVDWDMSLIMSYKGDVYYCADHLAKFRVSSGSITSQMHKKQKEKIRRESVALFDKHNALGGFGIGKAGRMSFIILTELYSIARSIIIKTR